MKSKYLLRTITVLVLLVSFFPAGNAVVAAAPLPPVDMFQLPWEQGLAWVALDGFDNGTKRPLDSSHHYTVGGAIDFGPHNNMRKGEDTSNAWVTAAADGIVVEISKCHLKIVHSGGWITEYQHLANFKVKLGDAVNRNQRLAVIANASSQPVCVGSVDKDTPHLHFKLWPTMVGATFAGWEFKYNSFLNRTTFTRDGVTVGLFQPLLNSPWSPTTPTPTPSTTTPIPTTTLPPSTATSTPPSGPYVSTGVNPAGINIGETSLVTVSLNNLPVGGYTSAEFTCTYDASLVESSNIVVTSLFGADAAVAITSPQNGSFIVAIAGSNGNKALASGSAFTFNVKGLQAGQSAIECKARVSQGNNILSDIPSIGNSLTIIGSTPTPTFTSMPTFTPTPVESPLPTFTPMPDVSPTPTFTATPTSPISDWLTFTNSKYGFEFKYPPQGQIVADGDENFTRIDLPFVAGTNLREKYLEVITVENANPCRSPLATSSMLETSETVIINGISFLKETGGDAGAGHLHQWIAYSTLRDNACVSLDFILHSLNAGNFPTPPPVFDFAAESAVFEQIVSTFTWLVIVPTATPTFTSTPVGSPTPTFTPTPISSPTSTIPPTTSGTLTGQVLAGKPVTVGLYNAANSLVTSVTANADGTFLLMAPAGTYTVSATASGFLSAQGPATLVGGSTTTLPVVSLLAGDIDNNNVIDQFDAMTIGMGYNTSTPAAADLNNDGTINVLDLELLAQNYRKTGPIAWQ